MSQKNSLFPNALIQYLSKKPKTTLPSNIYLNSSLLSGSLCVCVGGFSTE